MNFLHSFQETSVSLHKLELLHGWNSKRKRMHYNARKLVLKVTETEVDQIIWRMVSKTSNDSLHLSRGVQMVRWSYLRYIHVVGGYLIAKSNLIRAERYSSYEIPNSNKQCLIHFLETFHFSKTKSWQPFVILKSVRWIIRHYKVQQRYQTFSLRHI